jgi:hypothetical protein
MHPLLIHLLNANNARLKEEMKSNRWLQLLGVNDSNGEDTLKTFIDGFDINSLLAIVMEGKHSTDNNSIHQRKKYCNEISNTLSIGERMLLPSFADTVHLSFESSASSAFWFKSDDDSIFVRLYIEVDLCEIDGEIFLNWEDSKLQVEIIKADLDNELSIEAKFSDIKSILGSQHNRSILSNIMVEMAGDWSASTDVIVNHAGISDLFEHDVFYNGALNCSFINQVIKHGWCDDIDKKIQESILAGVKNSSVTGWGENNNKLNLQYTDSNILKNTPDGVNKLIDFMLLLGREDAAQLACNYFQGMMRSSFNESIYANLSVEHKSNVDWLKIQTNDGEFSPCVASEKLRAKSQKHLTSDPNDNFALPLGSI